jgi:outer membrane protein, heavy metal efflux system
MTEIGRKIHLSAEYVPIPFLYLRVRCDLCARLLELSALCELSTNRLSRLMAVGSILMLTPLAGEAGTKDDGSHRVQQLVRDASGKNIRWEKDRAARQQALQDARRFLGKPLTADTAVEIALLNNRSLQANFEEVGLSAADLIEAATIPNPRFDLAVRIPDKPPSGTYIGYGTAIDFLSIIMIPLKKRVAKDHLEMAALQVGHDILELVSQVKVAFYSLQASQQLWQRLKTIAETNAGALDLAQRQHQAGNISDLALAEEQAIYTRSHLDNATTEEELRQNRERLNRLLGLWGPDTKWQIDGALTEIPNFELQSAELERLALSQRLDLQAAYLSVEAQAKNLGLTKSFRLLGALDFGVESERETDAQTRTGPTFAIELPIFNQGQARIARGEAALRQAQDRFEALAISVRSQIRELGDELVTKRQIALSYQDELLPIQRRILNDSVAQYNAMQINDFQLFATKAEEERTEREYIEAVRDYWITRTELEEAVGGDLKLPVREVKIER